MRVIDLSRADLAILQGVLRDHLPPDADVWAFGSRTTGEARRYSDLDLAVQGGVVLDADMLGRLREALAESDLTIKIDVVDLRAVDPAFRRMIADQMVPLFLQSR
ncbi:MAG TPA: nucleotidyltransferase domain-containing protein [Rhodopila sp.]|jgi:predicted nucleotidyltransferase